MEDESQQMLQTNKLQLLQIMFRSQKVLEHNLPNEDPKRKHMEMCCSHLSDRVSQMLLVLG